jgi:hypothetical protein
MRSPASMPPVSAAVAEGANTQATIKNADSFLTHRFAAESGITIRPPGALFFIYAATCMNFIENVQRNYTRLMRYVPQRIKRIIK